MKLLKTDAVDPRALKILLKYNVAAAGYLARGFPLDAKQKEYVEKHDTSPEDLDYAKQHGLAFDFVEMAHDEAVRRCFESYALLKKKHVTDAFLASLSGNRLDWRSGLSSYAIMQTMPKHSFKETKAKFCGICSGPEIKKRLDLTGLNQERFGFGSLVGHKTPYELQFFLRQHSRIGSIRPEPEDFSIFNRIIGFIKALDEKAAPNEVKKGLKTVKGFKGNLEQARCFLEILGFCGILETEKHKGYLTNYTNPGLAPAKTHRSDWAYPVDFWTAKDGINREAFNFWFGDYKEISL